MNVVILVLDNFYKARGAQKSKVKLWGEIQGFFSQNGIIDATNQRELKKIGQ